MSGKPDNLLRRLLTGLGCAAYRLGLARAIIGLSPNRVRAMLYHDVDASLGSHTRGLNVSVSPATFARHLDYYQKYYSVIPVSQLASGKIPRQALVITFDDGYQSVHEHATPLLQARQLPACVYLISRAVNGHMVWVNLLNHALQTDPDGTGKVLAAWPELQSLPITEVIHHVQMHYRPASIEALCTALVRQLPDLTDDSHHVFAGPDEIRQMQSCGIEFGFHTADHYNLQNCDAAELSTQLDNSAITELLDTNTFAYPFGYFSDAAIQSLSNSKYARIMTVGNNNQRYCMLHLDRIEVFADDAAVVFAELEVVEPVISGLRSLLYRIKGTHRHARMPGRPNTDLKGTVVKGTVGTELDTKLDTRPQNNSAVLASTPNTIKNPAISDVTDDVAGERCANDSGTSASDETLVNETRIVGSSGPTQA